ncbi:DUF1289 domain-containing protein [Pseudoalteromonas tunicata]|jgi:predicted Fe-S protein YdhL (DUF1289 family)|uniref:DUF1289 domain-containing protein n=1 Tax=Pseudoalteromonas tunicata D2 TaxID=87626 RepID=A4C8L7_9GAMM|nr:DUF1289 domain-containing protein [Pseudoalteromonas tunicata]ATC93436.1 hypothetical protein PTUN_a0683 [Pseudoalteromonas tunicata]AXT32478.1 DUF1289 domain-containing protein [Pseudoalteromonas tunicata]EAR28932.1 hypothetical protein PTD2_07809 [Pseudoalteromonas tunicata D2]MDP4982414.1 DUF1289 domain-containing protein [Pseudoalteromonas tunicata]MDP5211709.1 DUF1289 domain-containing protein [Pseudoalteromonas tunicata]
MASDNPCVKNCCLTPDDVCLGCFRTLNEILSWHEMGEQEKQATLILCKQRRKEQSNYVKKDIDSR